MGGAMAALTLGALEAGANEVIKAIEDLRPGEFTWHPERQPEGAVAVVVSLPEQLVHVYRNGVRIAVSTCSSGKPGHATPTGVFVVLQKDKHHHSSTYNNAPMPNMNRLTWSGIALHAGNLPGYPASHGCVRLPLAFSEKLFGITHLGTPVIIAGAHSDPWELTHPGMVLSAYAHHEFETVENTLAEKKRAADWLETADHPIVSVIASAADRRVVLIENSKVLADAPLDITGAGPLGSHVFVLSGPDGANRGMHWRAISHHSASATKPTADDGAIMRLKGTDDFVRVMQQHMFPGMVMVLSDTPLFPDSRSGSDFVIMT